MKPLIAVSVLFIQIVAFAKLSEASTDKYLLEHKYFDGDYLQYELKIKGEEQARQLGAVNDKKVRKDISRPFESTLQINMVVMEAPETMKKVKLQVVLDSLTQTDFTHTPATQFFLSRDGYFKITPKGKVPVPYLDDLSREIPVNEIMEQPLLLMMERSGRILQLNGTKSLESIFPQLDMMALMKAIEVEFPGKPVEMGKSWTTSQPLSLPKGVEPPGKIAMPKLNITYTLVGREKIDNMDCLKIAVEGSSRLNQAEIPLGRRQELGVKLDARVDSLSESISGVLYFFPDEGVVLRSEYNVENAARFVTTRKQDWLTRDIIEELNCRAKISCRLL